MNILRFTFCVILIAISSCEKKIESEPPCFGYIDTEFQYPPFPEDGWKTDNWFNESKIYFAIPESILNCVSTVNLINTCLKHPQKALFYAYNSIQEGFETWVEQCNGFEELFYREDSGSKLLSQYQQMSPFNENLSENDFLEFEIILSQSIILSKLSVQEKRTLVNLIFELNQDKIEAGYKYSDGIIGGYVIMGRLMLTDKYQPFLDKFEYDSMLLLRIFVLEAKWLYNDSCKPDEIILEYAKDYLNTLK